MNLIIVESPTKAKTISRFIGKNYKILSSYGHIRDLPEKNIGIDIKNDFNPEYVIPEKAKKIVKELEQASQKATLVILATDQDREGEAIAWHIAQILKLNKDDYQRIAFHEITKTAIEQALANPKKIDMHLVDAQQARRILDRLVGYKLSPFLWRKVMKGLSAGRVQSVAVRLIVDREEEIKDFKPEEYWTIAALLLKNKDKKFEAKLIKIDDKNLPKPGVKTKEEKDKILKDLKDAEYKVIEIKKKEVQKHPGPPFTTSILQQEAARKLGFSAKQTMFLAQRLYEQGYITYHRTDSLNLSSEALKAVKKFIEKEYGKKYSLEAPRVYKNKSKGAQEAHEAIRPTQPSRQPQQIKSKLNPRQSKLYSLIWSKFIACQMTPARFDSVIADIQARKYLFRATGSILKFDGFLKAYPVKYKESELPPLDKEEILKLVKLIPEQHFTQPPARYTEASLIKVLEDYGIGRPSTYAPIISTIQERGYAGKDEQKRFVPTEIGSIVTEMLKENFPKIVDVKFTAYLEEDLDKIAENKQNWLKVLKDFYEPFNENLLEKYEAVKKKKLEQPTDKKCPLCKSPLVIKLGRFGKFLACSNFPKCKYTEPLGEEKQLREKYRSEVCDKCGAPMIVKHGKFGPFLACSNYPKCKNVKPIKKSTEVKCPKCKKGELVERKTKKGRIFYSCSEYPRCDFALWEKPINKKCPKCGSLLVETKNKQIKCSNKECDYQEKLSDKK
jgi:DNA topoisomerase I